MLSIHGGGACLTWWRNTEDYGWEAAGNRAPLGGLNLRRVFSPGGVSISIPRGRSPRVRSPDLMHFARGRKSGRSGTAAWIFGVLWTYDARVRFMAVARTLTGLRS
jgi:hypothetical protein